MVLLDPFCTFALLLVLSALVLSALVRSALVRSALVLSAPDLTPATLARDLRWLESAMKDYRVYRDSDFGAEDVVEYYTRTTFRDYRLLEFATGSEAMHTRLVPRVTLPYEAGHLRQLLYVVGHTGSAKNVLEIGSGKGTNSIFLAHLLPHVNFVAVDLVPDHVEFATSAARAAKLSNLSFVLGDASTLPSCLPAIPSASSAPPSAPSSAPPSASPSDREFDLIFGIESLCHLDTPAKMSGFMGYAGAALGAGQAGDRGRLSDKQFRPARRRRPGGHESRGERLPHTAHAFQGGLGRLGPAKRAEARAGRRPDA